MVPLAVLLSVNFGIKAQNAAVAQSVERVLGKDEVMSPNLISSFPAFSKVFGKL